MGKFLGEKVKMNEFVGFNVVMIPFWELFNCIRVEMDGDIYIII